MDNKFYVSLEVARLLKEKGYDEECISYYHDNCREVGYSFCGERNSTWEGRCVSAPSKAEAIDWLERKGVIISPHPVTILSEDGTTKTHWSCHIVQKDGTWYTTHDLPTRLEAEDAAIIKALEILNTRPTF